MPGCILCGKPVCGRGLCKPHYYQMRRRGRLGEFSVRDQGSLQERLLAKVEKVSTGCWEWTGLKNALGYPLIWRDGAQVRAHRVAFELFCGGISDDDVVCHRCDNPCCVRPEHLFKGTRLDNNRDAQQKGRNARGERNGKSKLTEADVVAIRRSGGVSHRELAAQYGIDPSTVSQIRAGKRWKHVGG